MIKLFRTIRQKLLSENKFSKYLLYAIGEIVLVVVGILIALQINNWNENKLHNQKVKAHLINLIQDLKRDADYLSSMFSCHSFKYHSMQYLLNLEGTNPYDPVSDDKNDIHPFQFNYIWEKEIPKGYSLEFIQLAYLWSHKEVIHPATETTVDELKSTGMFSKISPELKTGIHSYYGDFKNAFNGKVQILSMDWQASLAEDGFITTDIYKLPDPLSIIKNNPERIGLIKRMTRESGWILKRMIYLKSKNEELIQQIEKEIEVL